MFDILIKNATIVDGTGTKGWVGDAAIKDGRFAVVDHGIDGSFQQEINGTGLVLAPGFIDMHCHSDLALLNEPRAEIKLRQGVAVEVLGNCGGSLAPLEPQSRRDVLNDAVANLGRLKSSITWLSYADYIDALEKAGISINLTGLVGHGTLRITAMGYSDSPPDARQMSHMKRLLDKALEEGARGLSTGLIYPPGCYAATDELIELASVLPPRDGFYASHLRNEAEGILESIAEIIRIGEKARVPVHISHLKIAGEKNWRLTDTVIQRIEAARAAGVDITCDVYPYYCSSTTMLALLPPWSLEGGLSSLIPRLRDSRQRDRIIGEIKDGINGWENMYHNAGWDKITVSTVKGEAQKYMEGKTIEQLAAENDKDPFELILDLIELQDGMVSIVSESMNEENVIRFLEQPFSMVGSDGSPTEGRPHPRLYGTFPRIIRRLVRELGILTLEGAVYKMTGLTAHRLGLKDAGIVAPGQRANAVLFDPQTFADTATYENPRSYPQGLRAAIVNGVVVFENGKHTGAAPGRFYRS